MNKTILRFITGCLFLGSLLCKAESPTIILVIDDIGHNYSLGQQAIQLPGPIHYAVLPHSKNGASLAQLAHESGKEVLLHAPMSTISGKSPGPGALTPQLNQQEFIATLNSDLNNIPHIHGLNNHMGSQLTQMPKQMAWLMTELKRQQLYFLDSRTSAQTVAQQQAQQHNIPNLKRDVFLDNNRNPIAIAKQFEKLLTIADKNGFAIAIGHPYPETIKVLKQVLPSLALRGYQQRFASEFLAPKNTRCSQQPFDPLFSNNCQPPLSLVLATDT